MSQLVILKEIELEARKIDYAINQIKQREVLIEQEIRQLFESIKSADNIQEASTYFEALSKIQEPLSLIAFKYHIEISGKLRGFIRDFERIDDSKTKEYLYLRIKSGSQVF